MSSSALSGKMPKISVSSKRRRKRSSAAGERIPYARGFVPPTAKQRSRALHPQDLEVKLAREILPENENFFFPIPQPTSIDDWLAQYNEEGQTYVQFLSQCPWLSNRKIKYYNSTFLPSGSSLSEKYPGGKIYILPLNSSMDPSTEATPKFDDLADYAQRFYGIPIKVLPAVEFRVDAEKEMLFWDESTSSASHGERSRARNSPIRIRFHKESGHFQLKADSLLSRVKQVMPRDAICLMALTMMDIYDEAPDLFVAGLAGGNQRAGIFSLRRYDPSLKFSTEHWFEISRNKSKMTPKQVAKTMLQRSIKLLVHEIAHLLGVDHCIWYSCCMNGSGHLSEDFRQSMHLCPVDLRKLQRLCRFDVSERYCRLKEFFERHELEEEKDWVEKRLRVIAH